MTIVEEIRNDPQQGAKRLDSEYRAGLTTLARRICHDDGDAAKLVLRGSGQNISGLKLKLVTPANFDKTKKDGYMILEAPNGYAGHFDESTLPSGWKVEYETSAAFLKFPQPFVITVR